MDLPAFNVICKKSIAFLQNGWRFFAVTKQRVRGRISDFLIERTPLQPCMVSYIFREMMLYFLVSFCFFFFIFFVNQILLMAGKILEKHVPLQDVVQLIFYSLPSVIATAAPFATLVGTLMCLGRMAADNEILSIRALGFSYTTILVPMFAAGLLISVFSFLVNDILLPAGTIRFNKLYQKVLTSTPVLELESNAIQKNGSTSMICGVMTNRDMDRLVVIDRDEDKRQRYIISSGATVLPSDDSSVAMIIDMKDADVITIDAAERNTFDYMKSDSTRYSVFIKDLGGNVSGKVSPREMSFRDVLKKYKEIKQTYQTNVKNYHRDVFDAYINFERAVRNNPPGEVIDIEKEQRQFLAKKEKVPSSRQLNTYIMECNMKFSLPFGSLCFIFISFPVGVMIRKKGQSTALFSGIIFCFFYWAILITGQTMGYRTGYNGFLAMWLPNILVAGVGIVMTVKVFKK